MTPVPPDPQPDDAPRPSDPVADQATDPAEGADDTDLADELNGESPTESEGPESRRFLCRRDSRRRIDVFLQQRLKGVSRSRVQKLIDLGGVTINGQSPKASTTVKLGDVVDVILPPRAIRTIRPEPIPLSVLYEDDDFIVVNKQANLIVHPARSNLSGTLVNALAWHFKQQIESRGGQWAAWRTTGFGRGKASTSEQPFDDTRVPGLSEVGAGECRPGIIHRLDKNTTGVMVVAKRDEAHWRIARQFEDRSTIKAYLAVVHGSLDPASPGGVVEQPIGKHPTIREAYAVRHDSAGKHAVTIYRIRERYRGYTLVELELKTGRTHQIRVHLQYLGFPIVGDIVYGGEPVGPVQIDQPPIPAGSRRLLTFARDKEQGQRMESEAAAGLSDGSLLMATPALHAAYLRFIHPGTEQPVIFTAPVHRPMLDLIRALRQRPDPEPGPVAQSGYWVDLRAAVPD